MALFTAEHIPMISSLTKSCEAVSGGGEQFQDTLASFANSCFRLLKTKKFSNPATNLLIARAMTGAIVLFDRIASGTDAFSKKSPIVTRECIQLLKKEFPKEGGLLNAIQFSTKNFSRAPASIQSLFE